MARLRSAFAALLVVVLAGTLSACSGLNGTDGANFVVDAAIVQIAPADRTDPVDIAGPSLDDKPVNLADLRGGVVVLNVWVPGACRAARKHRCYEKPLSS